MSSDFKSGCVAILIPAYKPSDRLLYVVEHLAEQHKGRIVVVDDGSGLHFNGLFNRLRQMAAVTVLANAENIGKGAALKHGINHILVCERDTIGVVTADADGQHAVADILKVAAQLRQTPDHLIMGARDFGSTTPLRSKIGNEISRVVYRIVLGLKLRDTQTGLRGLPARLCRTSLRIRSNGYEFETEQLVETVSLGIPIVQVPIETIYEDNNSSSHFNPFFDSARIYFVVLRYGLSSIATALVDFVVFMMLAPIVPSIIMGNLASRSIALFVQFALLRSFVFRVQAGWLTFVLFVLYVATTGIISGALQVRLTQTIGVGLLTSKILVETTIFLFNFLFLRETLFRSKTA